jgi:hypothetical protein
MLNECHLPGRTCPNNINTTKTSIPHSSYAFVKQLIFKCFDEKEKKKEERKEKLLTRVSINRYLAQAAARAPPKLPQSAREFLAHGELHVCGREHWDSHGVGGMGWIDLFCLRTVARRGVTIICSAIVVGSCEQLLQRSSRRGAAKCQMNHI